LVVLGHTTGDLGAPLGEAGAVVDTAVGAVVGVPAALPPPLRSSLTMRSASERLLAGMPSRTLVWANSGSSLMRSNRSWTEEREMPAMLLSTPWKRATRSLSTPM
jgi:hypothetical protein